MAKQIKWKCDEAIVLVIHFYTQENAPLVLPLQSNRDIFALL